MDGRLRLGRLSWGVRSMFDWDVKSQGVGGFGLGVCREDFWAVLLERK